MHSTRYIVGYVRQIEVGAEGGESLGVVAPVTAIPAIEARLRQLECLTQFCEHIRTVENNAGY